MKRRHDWLRSPGIGGSGRFIVDWLLRAGQILTKIFGRARF
jgi:hypothetical protein